MREKITIILLVLCFTASYIGIAEEHVEKEDMKTFLKEMEKYIVNGFNDNYGLKLEMNHGSTRCMLHDTKALNQLATVILMEKMRFNVGSVLVEHGQDFMSWVFKYGL